MPGLNPQLVLAPSPQTYFVDKDTGLPLSNGSISFFQDIARTNPKDVYMLSGVAPNYTYTSLGSTIALSAVGTTTDNMGNDIILYYFPFDGTPDNTTSTVDLYFLQVFDSDNVEQFTREGWPNTTTTGGSADSPSFVNYIPNGQFLIHSDIETNVGVLPNKITQASTVLAQGGWSFERPALSSADDFVTFVPFAQAILNPTGNPLYYINVTNAGPGSGDSFKDIQVRFPGVNTFASTTQQYTFSFDARTNIGTSETVELILYKFFGIGGSAPTSTTLTTFTITNTFSTQQFAFTFGTNQLQTIGTEGDDYVGLRIRLPVDSQLDIDSTNWSLTIGNVDVASSGFSTVTEAETISNTIPFGGIPAYTNADLYLPITLGPNGFYYSSDDIGKVYSTTYPLPGVAELLCDGSKYIYQNFSAVGIPYSRLGDVLWESNFSVPIFGTGLDYFVSAYNDSIGTNNEIILNNNSTGATSVSTPGNSFFTVAEISVGSAPYGNSVAYFYDGNVPDFGSVPGVYIVNDGDLGGSAGTSGFTYNLINSFSSSVFTDQILYFGVTGGGSIVPSTYFTFSALGPVTYYVWFTVNGTGTDPAVPGAIGIHVELNSFDQAFYVALKIQRAVNGFQQTTIIPLPAVSIVPNSYWTANSTGASYYVWYNINNTGIDPTPGGTGIEVSLVGTETTTQVALLTVIAINRYSYAVPNLNGVFIRGWSGSAGLENFAEPFPQTRLSLYNQLAGNNIGSLEIQTIQAHYHDIATFLPTPTGFPPVKVLGDEAQSPTTPPLVATELTGLYETRPTNIALNYVIKY